MSMKINLPQIPVSEIFTALGKTPAGNSLKQTIRFQSLRHSTESVVHWKKILGPTAVTFSHLKLMYKITHSFLKTELKYKPNRFNLKEQRMLLLASACHDFGEAIIDEDGVGDILAPLKKTYHIKKEIDIFKKVLASLDINSALKKEVYDAYHEVIVKQNTKVYHFFSAVEKSEYVMTALNIYDNACHNSQEIKIGKGLVGDILARALPPVIDYAKNHYASISRFLKKRSDSISNAFQYSYDHYKKRKFHYVTKADIDTALKTWNEFKSNRLGYYKNTKIKENEDVK